MWLMPCTHAWAPQTTWPWAAPPSWRCANPHTCPCLVHTAMTLTSLTCCFAQAAYQKCKCMLSGSVATYNGLPLHTNTELLHPKCCYICHQLLGLVTSKHSACKCCCQGEGHQGQSYPAPPPRLAVKALSVMHIMQHNIAGSFVRAVSRIAAVPFAASWLCLSSPTHGLSDKPQDSRLLLHAPS